MKRIPLSIFAALLLIIISSCAFIGHAGRNAYNNDYSYGVPNKWRWIRKGLTKNDFIYLAGPPLRAKMPLASDDSMLEELCYSSNVTGAIHQVYFNKNMLVYVDWYKNMVPDKSLVAPVVDRTNISIAEVPRYIPLKWSGAGECGFHVSVEIKNPSGKWHKSAEYYTVNNYVVHWHTGKNTGRWRVRSLSHQGYGAWSDYSIFNCEF
jgi:hypothetical protein